MLADTLYRGIKRSQPSFIRPDGKTVTSAMFKDENGVSVDRQMERTAEEALAQIKKFFDRRLKGVAKLSESDVKQAAAVLIPAPTSANPYHGEIYRNTQKEMLTKIQQLKLADCCRLVYLDESIEWNKV